MFRQEGGSPVSNVRADIEAAATLAPGCAIHAFEIVPRNPVRIRTIQHRLARSAPLNMENFHGANFLAVRSDQTELIEQLAGRATRERLTPGDIDEEAGPASRPAQVFRDAAALHVLRWSMDRVALQRRFAAAEHRTVMGERRIERQRAIIERVRELGQDVGEAAELLVEFERQQTLALDELEKCRALLAAAT